MTKFEWQKWAFKSVSCPRLKLSTEGAVQEKTKSMTANEDQEVWKNARMLLASNC